MKKGKKESKGSRQMYLVCPKDKREFRKCSCKEIEGHKWVFTTKKELKIFFETGEEPDYIKSLYNYKEESRPKRKRKNAKKNRTK